MNFKERRKKIDQIWSKILRLNEIFEEENNVSEEELNLVTKYLRQIEQIYADNGSSTIPEPIVEKWKDIPQKELESTPIVEILPEIPVPKVVEIPPVTNISGQEYVIHDNTPFPPLVEKAIQQKEEIPEEKSINERFVKEETKDLHAKIVHKASEKISLADKFIYIGELFGNNPVEYAAALGNIDSSHSYAHAMGKLNAAFADKYEWSKKEETLQRFYDVIASKFGG